MYLICLKPFNSQCGKGPNSCPVLLFFFISCKSISVFPILFNLPLILSSVRLSLPLPFVCCGFQDKIILLIDFQFVSYWCQCCFLTLNHWIVFSSLYVHFALGASSGISFILVLCYLFVQCFFDILMIYISNYETWKQRWWHFWDACCESHGQPKVTNDCLEKLMK